MGSGFLPRVAFLSMWPSVAQLPHVLKLVETKVTPQWIWRMAFCLLPAMSLLLLPLVMAGFLPLIGSTGNVRTGFSHVCLGSVLPHQVVRSTVEAEIFDLEQVSQANICASLGLTDWSQCLCFFLIGMFVLLITRQNILACGWAGGEIHTSKLCMPMYAHDIAVIKNAKCVMRVV
jgi:hypothetical protein